MDNFFNSVFAAAAAGEHEEEEEEEEREGVQGQAAGREGGDDSGGGWSFGGLMKTFAEEIEGKREEREEKEGEQDGEAVAAEEGEGGSSGGGWSFGGLIKTLAEEMPQREEQEEAAEEQEGEREAEAAAAEEEEGEGGVPGGGWSFGGLMKTFATRSESVLEGYRRDLQDLGSGLRVETTALRAAAARAAAALPGALEAGASVASDRLESVGQAVDDLGAAAAGLLSHANEALRSVDADGEDGDSSSQPSDPATAASWRASLPSKKYTRFEAQVLALRADPTTFTEEPEDAEGFARWQEVFSVDDRKEEIEGVLRESPGLESFVERLVPSVVAYDTFWCRYFFAVDKLRQAEDARTKLVSRAMSKDYEEELSWEVDDEDDDNNGDHREGTGTAVDMKEEQIGKSVSHEAQVDGQQEAVVEKYAAEDKEMALAATKDDNGESSVEASTPKSSNDTGREEKTPKSSNDTGREEKTPKSSNDTGREEKTEAGDSSKESDLSVVSRPSTLEEDLSWEEIEDVGDEDEKKEVNPRPSPASKVEDVRKRLNSVEDDEELSWDVDE